MYQKDLNTIWSIIPEARLVGGCVRDKILGIIPKDYDFCSPLLPDEITKRFEESNFEVVQSGLQHGTVTVIINHNPYEITTLRKDVETDGRHASVEYVLDWEIDASRRDFTFNALYEDKDGIIYDYYNGINDLKNKKLRFIGSSSNRIKEDYLRILRYFRFLKRFEVSPLLDDLNVIKQEASNLQIISKERILAELKQIFDGYPWEIIKLMNQFDVSKSLFDMDIPVYKNKVNYQIVLSLLNNIETKLKLSNDDIRDIKTLRDGYYIMPWDNDEFTIQKLIQKYEKRVIKNKIMFSGMFIDGEYDSLITKIQEVSKMSFPVNGNDLINLGYSGKDIGIKLIELKNKWINSQFKLSKMELLS